MMKMSDVYKHFNATIDDCYLKKVTGDLSVFGDEDIQEFLKDGYQKEDPNTCRMTSIFNSMFTHQTTTFMFAQSTAAALFKNDPLSRYDSCNSDDFKLLNKYLLKDGIFVLVEAQVGRKAAVYELVGHKIIIDKLTYLCGAETIKAKKEKVCEFYHKDEAGSIKEAMRKNLQKKGFKI